MKVTVKIYNNVPSDNDYWEFRIMNPIDHKFLNFIGDSSYCDIRIYERMKCYNLYTDLERKYNDRNNI